MKSGSLRQVFPDDELHAQMARLVVLYEDLQIESSGILKKVQNLSRTNDGEYVRRYFLRRAVATLYECSNCVISLDKNPEFKTVKRVYFSEEAHERWKRAVSVCRKRGWMIRDVRNDVGGHFGVKPARRALRGFREGTTGKIEHERDLKTSRQIFLCHFVGELTARAFVKDPDQEPEPQLRKLLEGVVEAQRAMLGAVEYLIYCYIWPRFGRL